MFEKAARLKLRFNTPIGQLSVEDLWDLPLTALVKPSLDAIAIGLDKELKEITTTSFVKKASKSSIVDLARLKFDIVLRVIEVRQIEAEAADLKRVNAEKKQRLLELISEKQDEALKGKSVDELQALVNGL